MKYLAKPKPLMLGATPLGLEELIAHLVMTDRRFNESGPGIRAGIRIEDAIKDCMGLPYIGPIQPEHFTVLLQAAEEPTAGYPRALAQDASGRRIERYLGRQLMPFLDAIREAKDEPPKVKTDPVEKPTEALA